MARTMNLTNHRLVELTVKQQLGKLLSDGTLAVRTGANTGRSPEERYFVRHPSLDIAWGGNNQGLEPQLCASLFSRLIKRMLHSAPFAVRAYAANYPVEVHTRSPWHALFARHMFRALPLYPSTEPTIRLYHDPYGKISDYGIENYGKEKIILIDPKELRIAIIGTAYAGEIKKAVFTLCNYLLPDHGILPMHASANCLTDGSSACLLFGLSGTGKTALSADPERLLIGDDEILWSRNGLSNLEGGCYAKLIGLDKTKEPLIYEAVHRKEAILENIVLNKEGYPDFASSAITENTRASYPISFLENAFPQDCESRAPETIVFLTADAFGALPAVAKLDEWQARYHFLSGYSAKVAGTEVGVKGPRATFSYCFGAPFFPRPPVRYAHMLAEKAKANGAEFWLLNTGWTEGGLGHGSRFPIEVSRRLLKAIQCGELAKAPMEKHPAFGFLTPKHCRNVDAKYLQIPKNYAALVKRFKENSAKFLSEKEIVSKGGPA